MQQFRKVCKEYYDKIQKFEALQKTENNGLDLTYRGHSLSTSEIAKLAYFSLSAYIDATTATSSSKEFQEYISNIKSFINGNREDNQENEMLFFLDSRHKQNEFTNIELDAFKLIWEHIDKHISVTETN